MIASYPASLGRAFRVLVAPDSFKGTISARDVAAAISRGLRSRGVETEECPVGDGGEGTVEALARARGGKQRSARVSDALGRPLDAPWMLLDDGATAVLESADASGLGLLEPAELDAERASSVGTGELILAAAASGASRVLVAVGGTASTDGGAGALAAIEAGGGLGEVELVVLCDVDTEFGAAAREYAPQKGAVGAAVARLEQRLDRLAREWRRDPRGVPLTGAGGGLAGGLWAFHGARLRPGAEYVLDALGFEEKLRGVDAVVVGEGCLDRQSLRGKCPGVIASLATRHGVPAHAIVGACGLSGREREQLGLRSVREAGTLDTIEAAGGELAGELLSVA